jgi:uncharacterized protein
MSHPEVSTFREHLPGGGKWSHVIKRHQRLAITDTEGGANVSALFYNYDLLSERYNMPDTLKAQYTAYITQGRVLLSDMGRVLLSVVEDTCGWHDTICGYSDAASISARFGRKRYQEARNDFYRNAHDSFLVELTKWGMDKRDLIPNVNFFSKVTADEDGKLSFVPNHSRAGARVTLRAEMNTLVVLTCIPHPFDVAKSYPVRSVELLVSAGEAPGPADECRISRAESARAFENTERFFQ